MKHQYFMGFLLTLICAGTTTFAQVAPTTVKTAKKLLLFHNLPSRAECNFRELEKLAHLAKSENTSIKLNNNLLISGEVLENIMVAPGIQNVNIRVSNYGNALLNLSILTQPDDTKKIIGRIIHPNHGDVMVISEEDGKYYVTKHKLEFFMVE